MEVQVFKVSIFEGSGVYGKLIIEDGRGTLNYYIDDNEVIETTHFECINPMVVECILHQARVICDMKGVILYKY